MRSVLDVQVSCFKDYHAPFNPKQVGLLTWLNSEKHKDVVLKIRSLEDKSERDRLKASLPAITPSGTFSYRSEECLQQHSGFIQFDIDMKDNVHIQNYDELKYQISKMRNVAYCGRSVSGTGFWGLVPIVHPEKHRQHFNLLANGFNQVNINIDKAPANVASLRGYSFDPEAYFNHQAEPLEAYITPTFLRPITSPNTGCHEVAIVEECIKVIESRRQDITVTYRAWFEIGCSLARTFGECGRAYYHQVSQFYPKYSTRETDYQYTKCLKKNYKYTFGTFIHYCQQSGIFSMS